jgi:uncharacterized protein (TIGR02611 family)
MVIKASSTEAGAAGPPEETAPTGGSWTEKRRYDVAERQHGGAKGASPAADHQPPSSAPRGTTVAHRAGPRDRLRTTLDLIRANPTGRIALKVFVAITGAVVVAIGAALIPLPGPGWLMVIGGLGIWAIEFHWARRLLAFTRRNVHAWTRWVARQSWPVRILLGMVGLAFVTVVVWLSLKYSLGIDLVADLLRYLATH